MSREPDFTVRIVDANGDPDSTVAVIDGIDGLSPSSGDLLVFENGAWANRHLTTADMPSAMATDAEVTTAVAAHAAAADPHTGYLKEADFDANTILKADSDNTPTALTVAASTVVGRKASGNIAAVTMDEMRALVGALDPLKPTDCIRATFPRQFIGGSDSSWFSDGRELLTGIWLAKGDVIHSIAFHSATTAGSANTHQYFRLRDSAGGDLAFTADDGALAWGANTQKKLYISRTVTDAVASSGSAVITSATAAFTANDVGKHITFMGAGVAGAPFGGGRTFSGGAVVNAGVTILSVDSATQITVSANAGTSVASGGTLYIGTPYTVTADGFYYLVGMVSGGTVPKVMARTAAINAYVGALSPALALREDAHTSLTTPASAPGTASLAGAQLTFVPYAYVSGS